MFRAPTWNMSQYCSISSIWLTSMTSDTSLRSCCVGGGTQHPQALLAQPLEAVRRAARLERAAAQDLRAGLLHGGGRGIDLLLGLRRTGPGHDDDLIAADAHVADRDDGAFGLERAAGQLVGLGDPHHLADAVEHLEQPRIQMAVVADRTQHRAADAGRPMHVHLQPDQVSDDLLDLLLAGALLHDHHHTALHCLSPARPLAAAR